MPKADFAVFLHNELERRKKSNRNYSLRAFARDLDIEPSMLSKILRKKLVVSLKVLERLAPKAGLVEPELSHCREAIQALDGVKHFADLRQREILYDEYKMIQDWYHLAIFEMTALTDFNSEPSWIAAKLGITDAEVSAAVERLIALDFLVRNENGHLEKRISTSGLRLFSNEELYQQALQLSLKQLMSKSIAALDEIPRSQRSICTLTIAMDPAHLPEARKKIANFTRTLAGDLEKMSTNKTHIYELMVASFPLTKG